MISLQYNTVSFKKFSKVYVFIVLVLLLLVGAINFVIDPLFTFQHTVNSTFKYIDFDERTQKTNYLAYVNNNYDSILLGNSRATYLNTQELNLNANIFNYSVSAMAIEEFETLIDNFIFLTGQYPKKILIGIDLFKLGYDQNNSRSVGALENTQNTFYRYKNLLSMDTLIFSLKNIVLSMRLKDNSYDRKQRFYNSEMIKGYMIPNSISNQEFINKTNKVPFPPLRTSTLQQLEKLKLKYRDSQFIVFTLPIHNSVYDEWSKDTTFMSHQEQSLRTLVDIFGTVYHFFYPHSLSNNDLNFYDAFHFYPYLGSFVIQRINNQNTHQNFGTILTKENIDLYFSNTIKEESTHAIQQL